MRCMAIGVSTQVRVVTARNRNSLRKEAYMLRKRFRLEQVKKFPIMEFLELIMPQIEPEFRVIPVEDSELIGRAAETIPAEHIIRVKQSIYDAACKGVFWPRLVMAHELGHYLLHGEESVSYAHLAPGEKIPDDINAERQADIFAAELLAPVHLVDDSANEYLISKHFGVSRSVARIQINQARKVKKRHQLRSKQRKIKENG